MDLKEEAREGDAVDAAKLGSPHLYVWKDFTRALLASTEAGHARDTLTKYWTENTMKHDLVDAATDIKHFRGG
eukprot:6134703-Pyramimonas_sp.AAC.1